MTSKNERNSEISRVRQQLRNAYAELNRVGERIESQTRYAEVVETKLREALRRESARPTTVEIADPLPPLNSGSDGTTVPGSTHLDPYSSVRRDSNSQTEPDSKWWPREGTTLRPLTPNAGWWNYSVQGRAETVVGISVCGLGREALDRVIGMVLEQQAARRDFVPLFLTDSTEFDLFRRHGFVFEYLPGPAKRARCRGAQEWDDYAAERRALLERKWGLTRVISFGPVEFGKPLPAPFEADQSAACHASRQEDERKAPTDVTAPPPGPPVDPSPAPVEGDAVGTAPAVGWRAQDESTRGDPASKDTTAESAILSGAVKSARKVGRRRKPAPVSTPGS